MQTHLPPFAGRVPHWSTGSRRTTTKEPRVHKECTGYPQAIHIGEERHVERPASNDPFEGEPSCSATSSARNWHEQARQALTNRCRFHPGTLFSEPMPHVASTGWRYSDLDCQAAEARSAATWCWVPMVEKSHRYLPRVPLQKLQGRQVKLLHLLVDRCMGTSLKNHQLSLLNVLLQWGGKTG